MLANVSHVIEDWEKSMENETIKVYSTIENLRIMGCANMPNSLYTNRLGGMKGTNSPKAKTVDLEKNETKLIKSLFLKLIYIVKIILIKILVD